LVSAGAETLEAFGATAPAPPEGDAPSWQADEYAIRASVAKPTHERRQD
jgi:hypothetical protein